MTHNFGTHVVSFMLSWLKGLASWILRLINLSGGLQPLSWLARNWITLLVLLIIIGVTMDFFVWILRWRPHWEWFSKKRIVVNDASMIAEPDENLESMFDGAEDNVERKRYVVPKGTMPHRGTHSGQARKERQIQQVKQRRARKRRITAEPVDDVFEVGETDLSLMQEDNKVFNTGRLPRIRAKNKNKEVHS